MREERVRCEDVRGESVGEDMRGREARALW